MIILIFLALTFNGLKGSRLSSMVDMLLII
jgi:hypothetical protein